MIKLDWTLFLQFVNFMILMAVLNALLFKPLRAALRERRETIDGARTKIADLEEQAQAQVARYEAQLQEAKLQGSQARAALRKAAQEEEAKILGTANTRAAERLNTIKQQITTEAEDARQSLREGTESLAKEIASKVLGRAI